LLLAGAGRVLGWALDQIPGPRPTLPVWNLGGLDTYLPGLSPIVQGYLAGVIAVSSAGLVVFAAMRYMSAQRRLVTASILVVAMALSRSLTIPEFAAHAVVVIVWIALVLLIVRTCSADLIGLGVAVFWLVALGGAYELIQQPNAVLRWNGIAAAMVALLIGVLVMRTARQRWLHG
jgi:hypothetical protein